MNKDTRTNYPATMNDEHIVKNMSDTPLTDAAWEDTSGEDDYGTAISMRDFARMLERHLAAARAECEEQARLVGMGSEREARLMAERDEARASDAESIAMYHRCRDRCDALAEALRDIEVRTRTNGDMADAAVNAAARAALGPKEKND